MADEYFDKPAPRPLLGPASVRWACCTAVLLVVIGLLAAVAWHRPDDAVRAVAAAWGSFKEAIAVVATTAAVVVLAHSLR